MASLILFLINFYLGTFAAERAAYLLGPDSVILDEFDHQYISSNKHPFIFVFRRNTRFGYSFTNVVISHSIFDDIALSQFRQKIKGKWIVFRIGFRSSVPVPVGIVGYEFGDDIQQMVFPPILAEFRYRIQRSGPLKKISICSYSKDLETKIHNSPYADLGFLSQYLIPLGSVALIWQPTKGELLGTFSLCLKIQKPMVETLIQLIARGVFIKR